MWTSFTRKVGSFLGLGDDGESQGQQQPKKGRKGPTREERLQQLEESVELWTLSNTAEWLRLKGLEEFEDLFVEMAIDGDGILELADHLFDIVEHSRRYG